MGPADIPVALDLTKATKMASWYLEGPRSHTLISVLTGNPNCVLGLH